MRTNYKDYVPTTELRKYNMINNADGTVSLRDVTTYEQEGDRLSAGVLNELSQNANWQLTHAKSSTTHTLTGLSGAAGTLSCVFTASADYMKGDTFTVDGESYTVKQQNGEEAGDKLFAAGAVVSCIIDTAGKTVNFKSGGGGGKLKTATGTGTVDSSYKLKVSGLAFKPYMAVAYASYGGSNRKFPAFIALDENRNELVSLHAAITGSFYQQDSSQSMSDDGFTLQLYPESSSHSAGYSPGASVTWFAWGL